jgi:hypothetical protein
VEEDCGSGGGTAQHSLGGDGTAQHSLGTISGCESTLDVGWCAVTDTGHARRLNALGEKRRAGEVVAKTLDVGGDHGRRRRRRRKLTGPPP